MDTEHFWALIEEARAAAPDPSDADDVADRAAALLAARDPQQILRAQQVFWDLMAASYQAPCGPRPTSSTAAAPTTASSTSAAG